jgi:hypothetical protein
MQKNLFMFAVLSSMLLFFAGCTKAPSNGEIESAVKYRIENSGSTIRFVSLQILEKGKYNDKGKYWPYSVSLKYQWKPWDKWEDEEKTGTIYLRLLKKDADFGKPYWSMSGLGW